MLSEVVGLIVTGKNLGVFHSILFTLKSAFPACALFLLGNSMVGCDLSMFAGVSLVVPMSLVAMKVLVSAAATQLVVIGLGGTFLFNSFQAVFHCCV